MHDLNDFLNVIKKAAAQAVDASKPVALVFGKVTKASPLEINVEQKMTLTMAQLVLTRNVTNYNVNMIVDHETENTVLNANHTHEANSNVSVNSTLSPNQNNETITNTINSNVTIQQRNINLLHSHKIKGTKQFTVLNSLVER